ncbi:MAG: ABC transporter ATP-binding protein [Hydrogenophaga sp.]|uniref:ABC transporter ATP-binding protein n=1 Tax=Hydrogenophaga sp. TaxID=1904254 RepID=UPI0027231078|nr:ABC transporter ATP-binding protein [Hydrogenophaga sp.]MDO9250595.1 ABC transporter ATP-binding protein [Hydrogenophaga sp.]MDP2406567.1 ABC transporter ATP-binding protein [Hydrogenophaga sp.]MDP3326228.1 ABC transporter ATP-binding protein [Hydrogenophaga sp.]MDZ4173832.1 ABC transporter ATP-binding protein [Hydrogenophaga sp.]
MASALEIQGIRKCFGKGDKTVEVLKKIDIAVAPGEFLILVGPSGCGKSTLLNIIAGLEEPTEGAIHIGSRNVVGVASAQRDIAMVFQSYALYPTMSVADNIGFALEMRKVPKAEREKRIGEVAAMLQITHLLDRRPSQLSGGQRQRVAMGRALARQPQLFLFDEPLSNLDAKLRVEMRAEIKRLHQVSGITSVYVTHDQIEAMTLGSRIAVMKDGVLQQLGTPDEIYNRPANTYVATFIGSPTMNLIKGQSLAAANGHGFGILGTELPLTCPAASGSRALLGLRPEHIAFNDSAAWRGEVSVVEPTGADTYVVIKTAAGDVTVRTAPQVRVNPGDRVGLDIQASHVNWFDQTSGVRLA